MEHKTLTLADATIAFREQGSGTLVVLLHSSASSGAQWKGLAARLNGSRCIMPDLYGYGATASWPGRGPLTLADEAALVAEVCGRGEEPFHLVGHSYGGAVALKLALIMPERIKSLTVIEPVAFYLLQRGGFDALVGEVEHVAALVREAVCTGDYWRGMAAFVDYWNGAGAFDHLRPELQGDLASRTSKVSLDFAAIAAEETDLSAYSAVAPPALVICAENTREPTRRITELLGQTLPNVDTVVVPGAGHMSPLTHGDFVNGAIAGHLRGIPER